MPDEWSSMLDQQASESATPSDQRRDVSLVSAENTTTGNPHVPTLLDLRRFDDLNQIIGNTKGTVLIDFYADWCGPCKRQGQVLHQLESVAETNQSQIVKVDVDKFETLAKKYDVASLPTLLVIKDGKLVGRHVGFQSESKVREYLR